MIILGLMVLYETTKWLNLLTVETINSIVTNHGASIRKSEKVTIILYYKIKLYDSVYFVLCIEQVRNSV